MRLIDADELIKSIAWNKPPYSRSLIFNIINNAKTIAPIDNAPEVDITEEQAIDKPHQTGWMQNRR